MKEKKTSKAKKVLLMATSCVLVAAISVGLTLAYLTAKTNEKDNKFIPSKGIKGEVIEPNYEIAKALNFKPGDVINKDPKVDNDTPEADIWVGAKIQFKISVKQQLKSGSTTEYEDVWEEVDYNTFKQYVAVTDYVGDMTTTPTSNTTTGVWKRMTSPSGDKADYFFFDRILLRQPTDDTTESNGSDVTNSTALGTTGTSTADNSSDLFTKVTPNAAIRIDPSYEGTFANSVKTTAALSTDVFKQFKFKILITGYGVKDDATITKTTAAGETASAGSTDQVIPISTAADSSYVKVTAAILSGLTA